MGKGFDINGTIQRAILLYVNLVNSVNIMHTQNTFLAVTGWFGYWFKHLICNNIYSHTCKFSNQIISHLAIYIAIFYYSRIFFVLLDTVLHLMELSQVLLLMINQTLQIAHLTCKQ